jgi:hypothetical protein
VYIIINSSNKYIVVAMEMKNSSLGSKQQSLIKNMAPLIYLLTLPKAMQAFSIIAVPCDIYFFSSETIFAKLNQTCLIVLRWPL